MNEKDIKAQLLAAGAKEEDLAKVDLAKIEEIFGNAGNIDGLCKDLKKAYPDFNEAAFKKAIAENTKTCGDSQELSDSDLEAVAGGSVGSWLNDNKAWLIPVAASAIVGTYFLTKYVGKRMDIAQAEKESPMLKGRIKSVTKKNGKILSVEVKPEKIDVSDEIFNIL